MKITIVYQDEALVVIEKPAGVPSCVLRQAQDDRLSVEEWLQKKIPGAKLVHRLDNNTSGLLAAAKTEKAFAKLRAIWKSPEVVKKYTALVLGRTPPSGTISIPIAHHARKKKKMVTGGKKAREAYTEFKTIRHFPPAGGHGKNYSLLEVKIQTGVRHQIRIHLASIGHPIAGDPLYQKTKFREQDILKLPRHFLHLSYLQFPHPLTGKMFECKSELPQDLKGVLETL